MNPRVPPHRLQIPVNVPRELANEFKNVKLKRGDFSDTMQHKFDECLKIGGDLDKSMHQYLGDVYSIDQNIGRLLAAIDELGIRDNTIFVFSSDHGPAPVILTRTSASGSQAVIREGKWKLHQADRKREAELYDLSADPSESRNLAKLHPEVVDKLNSKLDAWRTELPKKYEKK